MTATPGSEDRDDLIAALQDRDAFRRRSALEMLGKLQRDSGIEAVVLAALSDPSGYVVRTAAEIAGRWALPAAAARLRGLVSDADPLTRRASLDALCTLGAEEDLGMLLAVFARDASQDVRNASAWAMSTLAGPNSWRSASAALIADPIPRHRLFACELVRKFGDDADREALRPLLDDADGHVRKAVALLLGERP